MHKLLAALFLMILAGWLPAQEESEAKRDLRELLQSTGAQKQIEQMLSREFMETQMRRMMRPEEQPAEKRARMEEYITEFGKEWEAESRKASSKLIEQALDTMAKYYTADDVKALVAFYRTPAGKKFAELGPKIAAEQMQAGMEWGQALGREIGERVGKRMEEKYQKQ